jgi:hypothetical protein
MFSPTALRSDVVKTGFEIGLEHLTNHWFVGYLSWDLIRGGVADTPFARVTGQIEKDGTVSAALIWLIDEPLEQETWYRVVQLLYGMIQNASGYKLVDCVLYASVPEPIKPPNPRPGKFRVSCTMVREKPVRYHLKWLSEELFQAQAFEEDNYIDVAMIEMFEGAGEDYEPEFATVCLLDPAFASKQAWPELLNWFAQTISGPNSNGGLFSRKPQLFVTHGRFVAQLSLG